MRTRSIPLVGLSLALAGLALAGYRPWASQAAVPPPASTPDDKPDAVILETLVNGLTESEVGAGWPVVVETRLMLTPDGQPISVVGSSAAWSDAFSLECKGIDGTDRSALFARAFASQKSIDLTHERSGQVAWILNSVDLQALPAGEYRIRAVLDDKKVGGTLPPNIKSNTIQLKVLSSPDSSPGAMQRKCVVAMNAARLSGDKAKALAVADAYLANHPEDIAVVCEKGKVQYAIGNKAAALASYQAALKAAKARGVPGAEYTAIQRTIDRLYRELSAK